MKINQDIKAIKNFGVALKDMEPYVKNPNFLIKGRPFTNFSLRPRETWANWLLCSVFRHLRGEHITFAEDPNGDGFIVDAKTGRLIQTEHVSALENPLNNLPKGEDRVISAINLKIDRGSKYANGKWLVVFFDGAGIFYRDKIRENIKGRHNFNAVFIVGLLSSDEGGYAYAVTEYRENYGDTSITFKVEIDDDFNNWKISQIVE